MRQADGSDLLGANDPRNASIGIIYVAPGDDRSSVLEAILMQDRLGRKQIAVVLPENSRAFQRPVDFDGLKNMRRGLKSEIIFVAPGVSGPADFARQRRFTVYTSWDSYKSAVSAESSNNDRSKKGPLLFNRNKPKLIPNAPTSAPLESFDRPAPPQPLTASIMSVNEPLPIAAVPFDDDDNVARHEPTPLAPFLASSGAGIVDSNQGTPGEGVKSAPSPAQDAVPFVAPVVPVPEDEDAKPVRPRSDGPIPIPITLPQSGAATKPLNPGAKGANIPASPPTISGNTEKSTAMGVVSKERIIYLDPNDDLTGVREKIEEVPARRIIMVVPQQTQLRSSVGWRLLHAYVHELRKEVQVISPDRQVRAVAKAAGFRVSQPQEGSSTGKTPVPSTRPPVRKSEPLVPPQLGKLDKMGSPSISSPPVQGPPLNTSKVENPPLNAAGPFLPGSSLLTQRELRIKVWEDEVADDNMLRVANTPNDAPEIVPLLQEDEKKGDYLAQLPSQFAIAPNITKSSGNLEGEVVTVTPISTSKTPLLFEAPKTIDYTGEDFGNYRLISKIASGNLGDIYLGEHIELGRKATVKLLSDHIDKEEFQNGMRHLARLIHPNIIRILDFDLKGLIPFLVMDYAPNGTLRHKYSEHELVPLDSIIDYVKQIASALQYIHDNNIVLGNVQPDNMLIGSNNEILLGGLDSVFINATKEGFIYIGKYTAPEQVSGKLLPASDQYALGVIVYEWLCGQPPLPFRLTENHHEKVTRLISSPPTPLLQKIPWVPPEVEEIVMKALAKEAKERFESVQVFADALEHAISPSNISHETKHIGQKFGKYRLISLSGEGGFADVYLGKHILLNTSAAVKILHTRLTSEDVEAFRREARILAQLTHPHIIRVLDFEVEDGIPFLVMDHAPNGTLRQRHPKGSRLPLNIIVSYVKQVANALQYAHNQKLIHRDVKPENMLLWHNNRVLLSDFGIAVVAQSSHSIHKEKEAGTVYYMAPEQCQGKPHRASDQYSLAVVVYEWLTGSCPFIGSRFEITTQHLTSTPPPLRSKVSTIPQAVEEVVLIALAKDPHKRFASVQAFAKALEEASKQ